MKYKTWHLLAKKSIFCVAFSLVLLLSLREQTAAQTVNNTPEINSDKRISDLKLILKVLPPDQLNEGKTFDDRGRVSFTDKTFNDWLKRTGELPPHFHQMPSIPFLPNPLILDEGGQNIPVQSPAQWQEKREWMKQQLQHYITGTFPPPPDNLKAQILDERIDGKVKLQRVELSFGPDQQAKLNLEIMIPPGEGPFPVFLTQWNHREWAQVAVRRGYIGCIYAGADEWDDTEKYAEIWSGQYDFTRLMRRAWGASRAIDYLYTLPETDREKIALTGHSRNGKTSLMAAAFDDRITACIPSSGGSGAEVPWRYTSHNYDVEDIALLASARPSWLHPRLRFFIGREHKLPVDQHSFMALIAPRGLMLSTALTEEASNLWGIEQAYHSIRKVYAFLKAENNIALRTRYGEHGVAARDMEDYIDFFDFIFQRSNVVPKTRLYFNYSFHEWKKLSGENIHINHFSEKINDNLLTSTEGKQIISTNEWEQKKNSLKEKITWAMGDEPPGVTNPGPGSLKKSGRGEISFGTFLVRPQATSKMGVMPVSPYNGFGDQLYGYLYYPLDENGKIKNNHLPVVIYLHEYDYSKGFNSIHQMESILHGIIEKGFAVFTFDMLGFANRIEEGTRFYNRYPNWSKMGKMVTDAKGAVDAMQNLDFIDKNKIIVAGYSLGATVGLYTAATDDRIAGVISIAGFTPMRTNTPERGTQGIMTYSHLHGLLPRLGFFVGNESRIPYDFHEILACIAPRPLLIIAPQFDKDAHHQDIKNCMKQVGGLYQWLNAPNQMKFYEPEDINRFSPEMRHTMFNWLQNTF
ncbi:MAG: dienelactone hydrolase family protein [Mariniphaga sp.]|nr:dienelactone hydrolase family protein [Mariniphaga sp.]